MSRPQPVLSVGALPDMLSLREAVLRDAGFSVFTASDFEAAMNAIQNGQWGLMLLCYSVPANERRELLASFRRHCPTARIVGVTNEPVVGPPRDVDTLVYGLDGPEALIAAVNNDPAAV